MLRETKTENGRVRGLPGKNQNITCYKGIPFAAPPVGELRWREPQPAKDWDGVLDCYKFSTIPMQGSGMKDPANPSRGELTPSEDCLYLNVWTPAVTENEKLPVMLWLFGGAYMFGSPAEMEYDGEQLANKGVVVVSVAYRVNVFSWFAHPELTKAGQARNEGYTSFGFLDQRAGMQWVKRNIAAFGGDPDNVTIFGHSAGGGSVLAHLCSSIDEGLFEKAIVMSGGGIRPGKSDMNNDLNKAESTGEEFIQWLGLSSYEDAKKMPAKELYKKSNEFAGGNPFDGEPVGKNFRGFVWTHLTDGYFLKSDWTRAFYENKRLKVPVLCGNAFMDFPSESKAKSLDEFEKDAREMFEDKADEYLKIVDFGSGDLEKIKSNAIYSMQSLGTENWCEWEARLRFKGEETAVPSYAYCFDERTPMKGSTDTADPVHGTEVPYAFDNLANSVHGGYKGRQYDIARQLSSYFSNFARTGNPNGPDIDGTQLPKWEPYTLEAPYTMRFSGGAHMATTQSSLIRFLIDWSLDWHKNHK